MAAVAYTRGDLGAGSVASLLVECPLQYTAKTAANEIRQETLRRRNPIASRALVTNAAQLGTGGAKRAETW